MILSSPHLVIPINEIISYHDKYDIFHGDNQYVLNDDIYRSQRHHQIHCLADDWRRIRDFKYEIDQTGVIDWVFGACAGPTSDAFNLSHEMAHVLQLSNEEFPRVMKDGTFNLRTPRIWVYDRYCCEPTTDKMSRRELETMVIQWFILACPDKDRYLNLISSLFGWLPDSFHFHKDAFKNSDEFKTFLTKEFDILLQNWDLNKVQWKWKRLPFPFSWRINVK